MGWNDICALKNDGTLWCWGYNFTGVVGNGTTTMQAQPAQVAGLTDVAEVLAAGDHACARKKNGSVWCWGDNSYGQWGDGTTTSRLTPVEVNLTAP